MKAVVYTRYGPPEVLQITEVEKPIPRDNEVLVRIRATTVNRTDCGFRKPEYGWIIRPVHGFFRPRRGILGSEFAGEVEATGKAVRTFEVGDEVFGLTGSSFGAHAECVCVPENGLIAKKPVNVSYEEAAAVCDGLMLGTNLVRHIDFERARAILINGASGSIGSACLQLARHHKSIITAVCDTRNMELVKSLGADRLIDYTRADFTKDDRKYDVVIDAVGKSSFRRCRRLLKPGGLFFSTDLGFLGQNVYLPLFTRLFDSRRVKFPLPKVTQGDILSYKQLVESGRYRAVIDRRYPLEEIVEATKYVETGQKAGNVVVTV